MGFYAGIGKLLFPLLLPVLRPYLRRSERAYVALLYEGDVLLVKNWLARDTWRLPGGGINKGESVEQALCREIKEELGLELNASELKPLSSGICATDRLNFVMHCYYYELDKKPHIKVQRCEITSQKWLNSVPPQVSDEAKDVLGKLQSLKMVY